MIKFPILSLTKSEDSNDYTAEWIWKGKRFGVYLDPDLDECGWWAVYANGLSSSGSFIENPEMKKAIDLILDETLVVEKNFKSYECQSCGDLVGYLGRFFIFLFGSRWHKCS